MVCEIKFGDPLLDKYRGVETLKEGRELMHKRINALFKYFLNGTGEDVPEELPASVKYLIIQLAALAEIPGFLSAETASKAGQPSRWNNEDGFILSAKVQMVLLEHPEFSEHKAIMKVARKAFGESVDEGVYRRYKEGLKNQWSYIYKVKYTVDHIKQLNHYDDTDEDSKKRIIEYIKRHLNKLYNEQFENESGKKLFKEDQSIPLNVKNIDDPVYVTRLMLG